MFVVGTWGVQFCTTTCLCGSGKGLSVGMPSLQDTADSCDERSLCLLRELERLPHDDINWLCSQQFVCTLCAPIRCCSIFLPPGGNDLQVRPFFP